ncbi:MAG: hypothetical protein ACREXJ_00150 [Gammaproteobacteria bacterium]
MAGTNIVACKRALIASLAAIADTPGSALAGDPAGRVMPVKVSYHYPGEAPRRKLIYGGRAVGEQDQAAMRGGGRVPRLEQAVITLHIEVSRPGADPIAAEQDAEEIAAIVVELLADDPQLQQQTGLLFAGIASTELEPAAVDDDGVYADLALGLRVQSFLR